MNDRRSGTTAGLILIGTAAVLLLVAALSGRGDMTSATLALVGAGSFIGGVFVLTLYPREARVSPEIERFGAVESVIDLTRFCTDLGLQGDAHLYPRDGGIVQVVPIGDLPPEGPPPDDYTYIGEEAGGGVQLLPPGRPLYDRLVREFGLAIPEGLESLGTAISEVGEDLLEIADKVVVIPDGDLIVVEISGYRLFDGCEAVRAASPKCCTMIACPTCSLFACMTVAGLDRPCKIEQALTDRKRRSIRLLLRPLEPSADSQPRGR